jgi:hypothetical protein
MGLLTAVGLVFNFGVILQTASTSQPLFIAGRFFAGFGVGLLSAMSKSHPRKLKDCLFECVLTSTSPNVRRTSRILAKFSKVLIF